jgi:hypothetical protein
MFWVTKGGEWGDSSYLLLANLVDLVALVGLRLLDRRRFRWLMGRLRERPANA